MIGCAVSLVILTSIPGAGAETAEGLEEQWRREYPRAAAELESQSFLAKGTFSLRSFDGKTLTTHELTVASSAQKQLLVQDRRTIESQDQAQKPYASEVACKTPGYAFRLRKDAPTDPYVLITNSEDFPDGGTSFHHVFDMCARWGTVYMQRTLLERMQSPLFVVKSVQGVREGGSELVRIDYDVEDEHTVQSGSAYLEPKRNWVVRKAKVRSKHKRGLLDYDFKCEVEYEDVGGRFFVPKAAEFFGKTPNPEVYEHGRLELTEIKVGDLPAEMFKLTAYGLPDVPLRPAPAPAVFSFRNPVLWGAIITAVASFVLLRVTRARKGPTPATIVR